MEDELLTVKEVAARLKVNSQTVRRWIRAGRLPAVRIPSGDYRVRNLDIARHVLLPAPKPTPEEVERRRALIDEITAFREELARKGVRISAAELVREGREEDDSSLGDVPE